MEQFRQGDILLVKKNINVSNMNLKKIASDRYVLAFGEKTGHSHVMQGDVRFFENGDGTVLCQVGSRGSELVHEEHDVINIPEGQWLVIRQREYDLVEGVRRVSD